MRRSLSIALGLTLLSAGASLVWPNGDANSGSTAAPDAPAHPPAAPTAPLARHDLPETLGSQRLLSATADPFTFKEPPAPPAPPPLAVPAPAPPPPPPPPPQLELRYVGVLKTGAQPAVLYVARKDQDLTLRVGDALEGGWTLTQLLEDRAVFIHQATQTEQVLVLPQTRDSSS